MRAEVSEFVSDLYPEHQVTVGMFQLLLPVLQFFGSLLFSLKFSDVVHRGFKNRALIPAHVSKKYTNLTILFNNKITLALNNMHAFSLASCLILTGHLI